MLSGVLANMRPVGRVSGAIQKANQLYRAGRGARNYKVAVVGAGGGIGQPLSLLLKQNPLVEELTLHDLSNVKGVATDLSHICTNVQVDSFSGGGECVLSQAVKNAHLIVVSAGLPRKPGMTRDQLLSSNGSIAISVATAMCAACPDALLAFITNPINSIVPISAEYLKAKGNFDPNRLFGVTTLDVVRSKVFIAEFLNISPADVSIPVIGGHSGKTILPLLSACCPAFTGSKADVKCITERIQEAGSEVIKAKQGKGSATLSMAYSAAHFCDALLRGLNGEPNIVECAYVASDCTELPYFATPLTLGRKGIKTNHGMPKMNDFEKAAYQAMIPILRSEINNGIKFAKSALKPKEESSKKCKQK